jgi:hypothetical protein
MKQDTQLHNCLQTFEIYLPHKYGYYELCDTKDCQQIFCGDCLEFITTECESYLTEEAI